MCVQIDPKGRAYFELMCGQVLVYKGTYMGFMGGFGWHGGDRGGHGGEHGDHGGSSGAMSSGGSA